jgi:hypothetical protein
MRYELTQQCEVTRYIRDGSADQEHNPQTSCWTARTLNRKNAVFKKRLRGMVIGHYFIQNFHCEINPIEYVRCGAKCYARNHCGVDIVLRL